MYENREDREALELRTGELAAVAPPLRLAGAEEDDVELNIIRGID
ncbi:hypothetical protein AB0G73_29080 [Streptomyces sp. NPDC020719]